MVCRSLLFTTLVSLLSWTQSFGQLTTFDRFDTFSAAYLDAPSPDTTVVLNFWATWCAPCIAELPYFEELNAKTKSSPVKVVLVSLDWASMRTTKLDPFLASAKLESEIVNLTDGKANQWIDRIDSNWSGAIPATLFFKGDQRAFYEKAYHSFAELQQDLEKFQTQ